MSREPDRGRSPELIWLAASVAVFFVATTMSQPFVPLYAEALGAGKATVGLIVASFALLPFIFAVSAGSLTDRLGARRMVILGSLGSAATSLLAAVPTLPTLILAQIGAGLAQLLVLIAAQTLSGSLPGSGERNYGWFTTAASGGQLVGPLVGGPLADSVRSAGGSEALGYSILFVTTAACLVATAVIARKLPGASVGRARTAPTGGARKQSARALLKSPIMQAAIIVSFSVLFTMGARQAFFPLYLSGIGLSVSSIGILLSLRAVVSMLVRPFMGALTRAFTRYWVMWGAVLSSAFGIGLIPFLHTFWSQAALTILTGVGLGLAQPLSMIAVSEMSRDEERGLALGVRLTGNRLAQLSNPLLFGIVAESAGLAAAFVSAGFLLAAAALLVLRWRGPLLAQEDLARAGRSPSRASA